MWNSAGAAVPRLRRVRRESGRHGRGGNPRARGQATRVLALPSRQHPSRADREPPAARFGAQPGWRGPCPRAAGPRRGTACAAEINGGPARSPLVCPPGSVRDRLVPDWVVLRRKTLSIRRARCQLHPDPATGVARQELCVSGNSALSCGKDAAPHLWQCKESERRRRPRPIPLVLCPGHGRQVRYVLHNPRRRLPALGHWDKVMNLGRFADQGEG
jgi:hypothetical protein